MPRFISKDLTKSQKCVNSGILLILQLGAFDILHLKVMKSAKCILLVLATTIITLETITAIRSAYYFSTNELASSAGYPCDEHKVITADGYILRIFRIPQTKVKKAPPVLLMHGLSATSDCWVLQGKKKDLAYLLHDAGYDVWMGDFRGNCYSRNHTVISPENPKFWRFSFNEMGKYDAPALVDHVLNATDHKQLVYIGHSMGTTNFFVMLSENPQYNEKISFFVGLAPAGIMDGKSQSPEKRILLHTAGKALNEFKRQRRVELFPRVSWAPYLASAFCSQNARTQDLCYDVSFFWAGAYMKSISRKVLDMVLSHAPAGISLNTALHYLSNIDASRFQKMNFGSRKNKELYGSSKPPEYDLSSIKVPSAIYYSTADVLVNASDVELTINKMPNVVYTKVFNDYNHIDYIWGRSAWRELYPDILKLVENRSSYKTLENDIK